MPWGTIIIKKWIIVVELVNTDDVFFHHLPFVFAGFYYNSFLKHNGPALRRAMSSQAEIHASVLSVALKALLDGVAVLILRDYSQNKLKTHVLIKPITA